MWAVEEKKGDERPTDEAYFGVLGAEGVHGGDLTWAEWVDLFQFDAEALLWGQVLLYLRPYRETETPGVQQQ